MATVKKNISKKTGKVTSFKWTAILDRDEDGKQIRLTKTVEPFGLTPKKEADKQKEEARKWEEHERAEYQKMKARENEERIAAWKEKDKITLEDFIDKRWIPKHVEHGYHCIL